MYRMCCFVHTLYPTRPLSSIPLSSTLALLQPPPCFSSLPSCRSLPPTLRLLQPAFHPLLLRPLLLSHALTHAPAVCTGKPWNVGFTFHGWICLDNNAAILRCGNVVRRQLYRCVRHTYIPSVYDLLDAVLHTNTCMYMYASTHGAAVTASLCGVCVATA